jgi:RNA polymerase sigma-70 factor, ECF subfamily
MTVIWDEITDLVLRAQAGDRAAFGELVERFQGSVTAMALGRMKNATDAQELAQEVFVHAMRKLPQLREPRAFAGWLRKITARMAINRLTRRGPIHGTEPEVLDRVAGAVHEPGAEIERTERADELRAGLGRLKPLDRQTLEAFYLRGRSLKQMAREFEVPTGTIKRRLHVARLRLKEELDATSALAV